MTMVTQGELLKLHYSPKFSETKDHSRFQPRPGKSARCTIFQQHVPSQVLRKPSLVVVKKLVEGRAQLTGAGKKVHTVESLEVAF